MNEAIVFGGEGKGADIVSAPGGAGRDAGFEAGGAAQAPLGGGPLKDEELLSETLGAAAGLEAVEEGGKDVGILVRVSDFEGQGVGVGSWGGFAGWWP